MSSGDARTRSRTIAWEDPAPILEMRARMPGLAVLREIAAGRLPSPPMGRLLGIRLTEVERGHIVFEGDVGQHLYNPLGMVHGGFAATLLDSAMGCSVHSCLEAGDRYTTIELKISYLKALTEDTGVVRGVADIVHIGRTTALAEARLLDAQGALYAHATSTCLIKRA